MKKIVFGFILFFSLFLSSGFGKELGRSGADFLKIDIGSRATALGGGYVALGRDAYAIFYNPGGLGRVKFNEFATMYNRYLEGINHGFMAYIHPTRYAGVYGVSIIYLNSGDMKETIINPDGAGYKFTGRSFSASFYSANLSFGYRINRKLSIGTNLKFIKGILARYPSTLSIGLDAGFIYSPFSTVELGLSFQNLGSKIRYLKKDFNLPLNLKIGSAFKLLEESIIMVLDIDKPKNGRLKIHSGLEINILDTISLRGGYQFEEKDIWSYSLGFGLKFKGLYIDYAFRPSENFGNTHRICLGLKFAGVVGEEEIIDYDGMKKKEEYIRRLEEKRRLKKKKKRKIREDDYDFYERWYREEYLPKKEKEKEVPPEEERDRDFYEYEEDLEIFEEEFEE